MAVQSIKPPPFFTDASGAPLHNGKIYVGIAGFDPATNPRDIYADAACTIRTTNPIPTRNGYPAHNGNIIGQFYVKGEGADVDYSLQIAQSDGTITFRALTGGERYAGVSISGFDAASVMYTAEGAEAYAVTLAKKLAGLPDILDYGAVPDGATACNDAVQAMFDDLGYAVVPAGDYYLATTTLQKPIQFREGGRFISPPGQTNVIMNRVDAPPGQHILGGAGEWRFRNSNSLGIGEDARFAYAAWFGVFPVGQTDVIQTEQIRRMMRAFLEYEREGVLLFQTGSYRIDGTIDVARAVNIKGLGTGTRKVIFDIKGSGYNVFTANSPGVRFEGLQFEQQSEDLEFFDGAQFYLNSTGCAVLDCATWNARTGVLITPNASGAVVKNLSGRFAKPPVGDITFPSDSSLVRIQGDNATVENIQAINQQYAPNAVVWVDGSNTTSTIINSSISNIRGGRGAIPVQITATTASVTNINIRDCLYSDNDGEKWPVEAVVSLKALNGFKFSGCTINGLIGTEATLSLVKLHHNTTGNSTGFVINTGVAPEPTPSTDPRCRVFDGAIYGTGNVTGLSISGMSCPEYKNIVLREDSTGRFLNVNIDENLSELMQIEDDAVGIYRPWVRSKGFAKFICYGPNYLDRDEQIDFCGTFAYAAITSSAIRSAGTNGPKFDVLTNPLFAPTGTTGTNGNISVWPNTNGNLHIENRSGDTVWVTVR